MLQNLKFFHETHKADMLFVSNAGKLSEKMYLLLKVLHYLAYRQTSACFNYTYSFHSFLLFPDLSLYCFLKVLLFW